MTFVFDLDLGTSRCVWMRYTFIPYELCNLNSLDITGKCFIFRLTFQQTDGRMDDRQIDNAKTTCPQYLGGGGGGGLLLLLVYKKKNINAGCQYLHIS